MSLYSCVTGGNCEAVFSLSSLEGAKENFGKLEKMSKHFNSIGGDKVSAPLFCDALDFLIFIFTSYTTAKFLILYKLGNFLKKTSFLSIAIAKYQQTF